MGAQWKREFVQDHKFDFINVDDFIDNSCWRQFTYSLVFAAIIRGILVYCSDIFTAANLLANSNENSFVPPQGIELEVFGKLPFEVYKYLFSGCILLSFALLGWEIRRARAIIVSRDISYAFTSLIASRYYSVRSYPHYCFFAQINNSKKTIDEVAFFCFFTFRNWKRLILADAPRQIINATILYQTFHKHLNSSFFDWDKIVGQGNNFIYKKISLGAMMFTVFMFALSLIMLISAVIMYIPLVNHIRGNLKEFCCHEIGKRIGELIAKKSRTRAADEAGRAGRDAGLAKATLPSVPLPDEPSLPSVAGTPRIAYAKKSPLPYAMQTPKSAYSYIQQQPPSGAYIHSNNSNVSNSNSQKGPGSGGGVGVGGGVGYPPPAPQNQYGYDYYQTKSPPPPTGMVASIPATKPKESFSDPYAESAFTSDDVYGGIYGQDQGQPYMPRARRYDDYITERSASPIQSQYGSDLDSHHGGGGSVVGGHSGGGGYGPGPVGRTQGGGYGRSSPNPLPGYGNAVRYAGHGASGASYGNEYQQPTNPRRQDTAPNRNIYRGGGAGY
ncbi:hypothetical protein BGX33_009574 [Mortierella sp. NVP41]|nr:hypothetical protein BGX33_009574 [Mortierella sp. NVP41]